MRLKTQLDMIVSPVEALHPEKPREMLWAAEAAAEALERKRLRMPVQRQRLLDATGHVDAELLAQADATAHQRRTALGDQSHRQSEVLQVLRGALVERHQLFEELDIQARSGPPALPPSAWTVLYPESGVIVPTEVDAGEQPSKDAVRRSLLQRGEERIEALAREFQQKHLQQASSQKGLHADLDLEEWKVRTHQELLEGVRSAAEVRHREILRFLKDALVTNETKSMEQISVATGVAEHFKAVRTESIAQQCRAAEANMAKFTEHNLEQARSRRRRIEICALKRWGELRDHLDSLTGHAEVSGLIAVGEATQRCVAECHEAIPIRMPSLVRDLKALDRPKVVNDLVDRWLQHDMHIGDRIDYVLQALEGLPDAPETCAAARGILLLLDDELSKRIKGLLRRRSQFESVLGEPALGQAEDGP